MKLISWNVNGIRAVYKKGFVDLIRDQDPDVLCVQETKGYRDQCEPEIAAPEGRMSFWSSCVRPGYSGVATYTREYPASIANGIGIADYDTEGRIVVTEHSGFMLYNIYFPNGGSGPERHDFKQRFLRELNQHLAPMVRRGQPIIVTGDYNVAHTERDIYDPRGLANESGFLIEERQWFDQFLALGFVDTFRRCHPEARDRYTWWSYFEKARPKNQGWRIDYFCVTQNLLNRVKSADILDQVTGSDHCPVVLELS